MKDFTDIVANLGVAVGYSMILLYFVLAKISKTLDKIVEKLNAMDKKIDIMDEKVREGR